MRPSDRDLARLQTSHSDLEFCGDPKLRRGQGGKTGGGWTYETVESEGRAGGRGGDEGLRFCLLDERTDILTCNLQQGRGASMHLDERESWIVIVLFYMKAKLQPYPSPQRLLHSSGDCERSEHRLPATSRFVPLLIIVKGHTFRSLILKPIFCRWTRRKEGI